MKTIILREPGRFEQLTRPCPSAPQAGEVLLKIKRVSICGTDLHAYHGRQPFFSYPRVLGHEIAAEVMATGVGVTHLAPGDLCCVEPYRNAVEDQAVRRGKTTCGSQLTVLGVHEDGALQEYIVYRADKVHGCNGLTLDETAIVEPFAIGSRAIERAEIGAEDIVLIVGAGPIGIGVAAMGALKGARIMVLDINEHRLAYVKKNNTLVETILLTEAIVDDLKARLSGDLPTIVIDATGNKKSMEKSFDYVAAGGMIVFLGLFQGDMSFHDPLFHRKELTLKASRAAMPEDFKKVIAAFRNKTVNTAGYITHRLNFNNLVNSFEKLCYPEENVIKAIIDFD